MKLDIDCLRDVLICVEDNTGLHQSCVFYDVPVMEKVCSLMGIDSYVVRLNGFYTIVLNDVLSMSGRIKAYNHEIRHIIDGDLDRSEAADFIELRAHGSV